MESLNLDALGEIIEYLPITDVTRLASTSKYLSSVAWRAVKRIDTKLNKKILDYILSRNLTSINHITLRYPKNVIEDLEIISEVHPLTTLTTLKSIVMNIGKTITTVELFRICTYLTQLESIKCVGNIEGVDVAVFSRHTNLTTFTWQVDPSITNNWSDLTQLRKLKLWSNFNYYNTRCNIRTLTNLTSIDISSVTFSPEDEDQITCLTNLREVRSKTIGVSPEILKKLPKLSSLDFSEVDEPNIEAVSTQLTKLKFAADFDGYTFPDSSLLTNLKHLVIEELTHGSPANFYFTHLNQLRKIDIKNSLLIPIIAAADLTNLSELTLRRLRIMYPSLTEKEIIPMCRMTSLKKLSVSAYNIHVNSLYQHVSNLSNLQTLVVSYSMSDQPLKPESIQFLRSLTLLTYLQIPLLTPDIAEEITTLTQLIELHVEEISESLVYTIKSFPFRVTYEHTTHKRTTANY